MDLQIRTVTEDALPAFFRATEFAFSVSPSDAEIERERRVAEPERCIAAFDGTEIVGTAAALTMMLTVPGGQLEIGYVTAVGVRATHRRRGVNTQLMRRQLDDARERGELLAVLQASEGGIYGRYGYGLGTFAMSVGIGTDRSDFVRGYAPTGVMRLVQRDEGVKGILAVNAANRLVRPGMVQLDEPHLDYQLTHDHGPDKDMPPLIALHETGGDVDGYVVYKVRHEWPEGFPRSVLTVRDLDTTAPGAYADVWRYVLDTDLMERVEAWDRPVDEPLVHLVQEPRRLRATLHDSLWVRLVDLAGAFGARRYASDDSVVFEVSDRFCSWNEGRYALESSDGAGAVDRTDVQPDIVCTVNEIGAAYLGGTSFRRLHRAGLVEERTEGALARADAMFAWDPAPWCPYDF